MWQILVKAAVSGALVAGASELARRSSAGAAIVISLPLTSMLALTWLYLETGDSQRVVDLSWAIMWVVLPSIVFFVVLPVSMHAGASFWLAMAAATAALVAAYGLYALLLTRLGVAQI